MTAAPPPMIRMAGVNKYFGSLQVLKDIDLEVDRGQVVVVLGPSGSGKSTLCRTINRLEPIDEGSIEVDGQPLPARAASSPGCGPTSAWCSSSSTSSRTRRSRRT